jgi:hypothetical protein
MSIRIAMLGAALAAVAMSTAAAADGADKSLQFGSEAEFVAKFGEQAQKIAKGQYVLQRGATSYTVNFGAAALRATLAEVEERLARLSSGSDGSAKAASDRAQLEQRRDELWQRLSVTGTKEYDYQPRSINQCGYHVELLAIASPNLAGGSALANAEVTPNGSVPPGGWHALIGLYATAGASNLDGNPMPVQYDDFVGLDATDNTMSPSRPAQTQIVAWYTCLRATSSVEVIAPSGNIWFPYMCGSPVTVVARHKDMGCPSYF